MFGEKKEFVRGITCSGWSAFFGTVESRVSRLDALLQGLGGGGGGGGAPGTSSRFLPDFVSTAGESHGSERRERRGSTRSRMPVMRNDRCVALS
ncbi:potassium voltage-gated channel subfamily H member 8 [Lates japonicus]|uniref:Potassium voltage-gated channel subfamily H member 8 n=1 Tax=Lates japonicus TaxID=270547 RepID=A0AAD3NA12_LATJO|nr:potassium voltage-gated channel subfamily H member 8 [Lates japonicus]